MIIDPTLQVALCSGLEKLINQALRYDPGSRIAMAQLHGKVLAIEFTQPTVTFYFCPTEEGVQLLSTCDADITTRLVGSPLALLALARGEQLNLSGSGVEVFGSTALLIDLQKIVRNLDIDWEEAISAIIGDIAAHEVGRGVAGFKHWFTQRKQNFERLLGEFLTEEVRVTPSKVELNAFYQQVDELRLGIDRARAKLQQLRHPNRGDTPKC